MKEIAVLLMAYGTPDSIDDVEPYLTDIRGGRKPNLDAVEDLKRRYRKIGGHSPLLEITKAQAAALEKHLNSQGVNSKVYVGMKHWHPYIREVIPGILKGGFERIIGLVLAPHYSKLSIGGYKQALEDAVSSRIVKVDFVESWHDNPLFHSAVQEKVEKSLVDFKDATNVDLLFTAHSLPERILATNDPYPAELKNSCNSVARIIGRSQWSFAYQSAGQSGEKWLGPDIIDYLGGAQSRHMPDVLVTPIGFVADHLEILYDIDIEAMDFAKSAGLNLKRTDSLNSTPTFIEALGDIVSKRLTSQ